MSGQRQAIVIGGSAGAWDVVKRVLTDLPADLDVPVALVLHRHRDSPVDTAAVLARAVGREVMDVEDKAPFVAGRVHLAPPDYHLLVESADELALTVDAPVHFCRPAIDPLFETAALVFGAGLVAVVLSGANADGAAGAACVVRRGGVVIVQDPASAQVATMPAAAVSAAGLAGGTPIDDIAGAVVTALSKLRHTGGQPI